MYPFGYKIFQEWNKNYSSVYKESIFEGFQFLKKWSKLGVRGVFGMGNLMVQTVLNLIDF